MSICVLICKHLFGKTGYEASFILDARSEPDRLGKPLKPRRMVEELLGILPGLLQTPSSPCSGIYASASAMYSPSSGLKGIALPSSVQQS
jgi:hypothetical protein